MMDIQQLDLSVDVIRALLWEDDKKPNLTALIERKNAWYAENFTQFWQDWITDVFDLRTANDFGLTVWAIILDVPAQIVLPPVPYNGRNFGFGLHNKNFSNGNFQRLSSTSYGLTLDQRRLTLRLRYYQLVSAGTLPEINAMCADVFNGFGKVYALDGLDMTMEYVFTFPLPLQLKTVLDNFDLLPRPAGVGVRYITTTRKAFGFGPLNENFNNGTFLPAADNRE